MTNIVLRNSGLPEIPDDGATFNTPLAGLMTRYQLCAREFVRITHEMICVSLPTTFARRRFALPIDNIQGAIYNLDPGISVESITFDSFRNLSTNPPGPGNLRNWTYEYFTRRYPDVSLIYSGAPTHYIFLEPQSQIKSPIYQVRFFPNPDQPYTLEYIAQINRYNLTQDTSIITWPPEYEHALVKAARFELEDLLGEGKAGSLYIQAQTIYQKIIQKATKPGSERKFVRMAKMFHRRSYGGFFDSPPDTDAPYNTYNNGSNGS